MEDPCCPFLYLWNKTWKIDFHKMFARFGKLRWKKEFSSQEICFSKWWTKKQVFHQSRDLVQHSKSKKIKNRNRKGQMLKYNMWSNGILTFTDSVFVSDVCFLPPHLWPGCVEAYAYHAQGGATGNLLMFIGRKPIQQFAVPASGSVFCCSEMEMVVESQRVAWIFFKWFPKKKNVSENWRQNLNRLMFVNGCFKPVTCCNPENSGRFYIVANEKDEKAWSSDLATGVGWYGDRLVEMGVVGWEAPTAHFCHVVYIVDENMTPYSKGTLMEHQQWFKFCWGQFTSAPHIADEEKLVTSSSKCTQTSLQVLMVLGAEVVGGPTTMFTLTCISFSFTRWWVPKCLNFHCLNILTYMDSRPSCNPHSYILSKQIFNLLLKPHIWSLNNPWVLKLRVLFGHRQPQIALRGQLDIGFEPEMLLKLGWEASGQFVGGWRPWGKYKNCCNICRKSKSTSIRIVAELGGGFIFFVFTPILREMIQIDKHIYQMGGSTT